MSDITTNEALVMIEHGLREDVLPAVADAHAAAALRAALTILANVRHELAAAEDPHRDFLAAALPLAGGVLTDDELARLGAAAPVEGRRLLLAGVQRATEDAWRDAAPDLERLALLRRIARLDAESRAALAR